VVARLQSTEAVKAAAAAGLGLGVISELAARRELAAGTLRGFRVKGLNLRRQFYLITHKQKVLSPATEALRCYLIEKAGEEET
jgi:DNA-binding transcriptional LysR family regulator